MTPTHEWQEIMAGFRGQRLAVHEDLTNGNANMVNLADLKVQEALGWLVYHRLVRVEDGQFQARQPREAAALWRAEGAAKAEASDVGRAQFGHVAERLNATPGDHSPERAHAGVPGRLQPTGTEGSNPSMATDQHDGLPAAATPHRMKPGQPELFG